MKSRGCKIQKWKTLINYVENCSKRKVMMKTRKNVILNLNLLKQCNGLLTQSDNPCATMKNVLLPAKYGCTVHTLNSDST